MKRYKDMAGKRIGNRIYVHKKYAYDVIPESVLAKAKRNVGPFCYECIMWNMENNTVRFDASPDFNTAREPHVGSYVSVDCNGKRTYGHSNAIWHNKWLWVKDEYDGFDVGQAKRWTSFWKETVHEVAKGTDKSFNEQLKKYGLGQYIGR